MLTSVVFRKYLRRYYTSMNIYHTIDRKFFHVFLVEKLNQNIANWNQQTLVFFSFSLQLYVLPFSFSIQLFIIPVLNHVTVHKIIFLMDDNLLIIARVLVIQTLHCNTWIQTLQRYIEVANGQWVRLCLLIISLIPSFLCISFLPPTYYQLWSVSEAMISQ